ncbi:MAG: PIN domain-containing protein [Candidatus Hydrogenedentes bacterium]|nr:PIN domain-containing protein [Candidatus Hydrogenedentota bacterium]
MRVLVDTCVWSLALRRLNGPNPPEVRALTTLVESKQAFMIGPVRQELLSGVKVESQFRFLSRRLEAFPDISIASSEYVLAAEFYNRCSSSGIQGSHVDFLICAVACSKRLEIMTVDKDFRRFSKVLPIKLFTSY